MITRPEVLLDDREVARIVEELLARRPGYTPEWLPADKGPGAALAWIFARYLQAVIKRLNRTPEKNKLAFLDLLGLDLVPAQAARAPVVFELAQNAFDARAEANTQLAAPPPPEGGERIVFETGSATGIAAAKLTQVFSLWPGRDGYADHSEDFLAGRPFKSFDKTRLQPTPHEIYLAHDTLLALAGEVRLDVRVELDRFSDEPLDIVWEYWDGRTWRGFKFMQEVCAESGEDKRDGTDGLTRSGGFLLETDCAESVKTTVNAIESFWIRGRLNEPLTPDPAKALPEIDSLRLSIVIDRTLKATLEPVAGYVEKGADAFRSVQISGSVLNEAGSSIGGATVKLTNPDDPAFGQRPIVTREGGEYRFSGVPPEPYYDVQVSFFDMEASVRQEYADTTKNLELDLSFIVTGLEPDKAFADETELDVSKPFYPFGQQPQPGSAFYFTSEEVLSKPGAEVRIAVIRTVSPQDEVNPKGDQDLPHKVFWEYWNGRQWAPLAPSSTTPGSLLDLDETEIIDFTVPEDLTRTVVNEQEALWIRARLVSGGFGVKKTVSVGDADISYVIYRPPALSAFRMGYTWQYGPFPAERVLTRNDFQFADRTFEANWPGSTFLPFASVSDTTPALYMGFDRKLPVDRIGLFFDIVEERGVRSGPALVWEYWDGSTWRALSVEDDTADLRLPGILSFIAAPDSQPLMRFDAPLHFLRGRLKEDGPPGEPVFNNIFPNAVWAWQRQTFDDFPLGTSTGLPDQVFNFINFPVLAGERIEVREMTGPRANVEWRILAEELAGDDPNAVRDLEEMLGREGEQTEIVKEGRFPYIYRIRLVRDKNKRVSEVWVRWEGRLRLFFSEPDDRHYVIDRAGGRLVFGDGIRGKIPPAGTVILAKEYRAGGGLAGNVPVRAINQLLSAIPGVQLAFNPQAAGGGSDGETLEAFGIRGPLTIRHRGRAATPSDYETLAREASPAVAVARAIANRNPSGRTIPGWVTLLIIPQSREARPQPSFGLRRQVLKYVEERAPADLAEAGHINVTGPDYLPVDVDATIAPVDPSEAGAVERAVREALGEFFHPLRGGPEGRGWELGRDVYLSDVASVLERVAGVDYVEEQALLIEGARQGERVPVADDRIVVAGDIRLKLKAAAD